MDKDLDKKEKKRKSFVKSKVKGNGKVTSLDSVRKKSKLKSQKQLLIMTKLLKSKN